MTTGPTDEPGPADRDLPDGLVPGRRTPEFTATTVPPALLRDHRTSVWARLEVVSGTVEFVDDDGPSAVASPDRPIVFLPDRAHRVSPSTDAVFAVQFFEKADQADQPDQPG